MIARMERSSARAWLLSHAMRSIRMWVPRGSRVIGCSIPRVYGGFSALSISFRACQKLLA